jgi:large-conductance mechanosensitive channel
MSCDVGIYGINEESLSIAMIIALKSNGKVAVYDNQIQSIIRFIVIIIIIFYMINIII